MGNVKMTAEDKRWQAESDARTLMEAKVIQKTPERLTAAAKVAKDLASKAEKEATAMKNIAAKGGADKGKKKK